MKTSIISLLFLVLLPGSILAQAQTLDAGDAEDWGSEGDGQFLDLTATNAISILSFDIYSLADTGDDVEISIYSRPGSYMGFEGSSAGWTLVFNDSRSGNADTDPDTFALPAPLAIAGGDTVGILMVAVVDGLQWQDGGDDTFNDANLTIFSDLGSSDSAFSGNNTSGRVFAGSVTYSVSPVVDAEAGPPIPVPTMSAYALALTVLGLLLVASRRFGRANKRN
jgi:hypothetical protein